MLHAYKYIIVRCSESHHIEKYDDVDEFKIGCRVCRREFVAYIISRAYAQQLLNVYKFSNNNQITINRRITSETALIESNGVRTKMNLVIEEAIDTNIQSPDSVIWHREYFSQFGYHNYI